MRGLILLVILLIYVEGTTTETTVEPTTIETVERTTIETVEPTTTLSTVEPTTIETTEEHTTNQFTVVHTTTQSTVGRNMSHLTVLGHFYPFGVGDIINARSDDGSSSLITLQRPFLYFGTSYNYMYVNNNGDLTFDQPWYSWTPYQFPLAGGRDIIAPFWTDIDNRGNGVISYQQYTSGSVLSQATHDINQYFPQLRFNATWVFVATWDRVAYFYYSGTETTFQVVLISNDHLSFILMNYGVIAPTNRIVQAGYDTFDSSYYFSIPGSFQYNYTSFTYSSNVNVPGRWAFRVDNGTNTCRFNDQFVPKGATFWTDNSCQQKCTCTRGGLQCISQPCTFSQACRPAALQYSCQNVQRQTCTISGDPHFYTFDNQIFHFQGTCTYILSEACSNDVPYYRVEGKNEHRGSTYVSWTSLVKVFVYHQEVELVKDHPYEAKVNGTFTATPFSLHNGSIQVYRSGFSVVISTAFGLVVSYDAYSYVTINVPYDYQNVTCGLCGNFNHHPEDDFRTPLGEILSSDSEDFGDSWKAYGDTDPGCEDPSCSGFQCARCTTYQRALFHNSDNCGILSDANGPFANCHSVLSPQTFIDSCVYDLCVGGGYQPILCHAISVYATQCQQLGVQLGQWRRTGFCEIPCLVPHSHYEFQGTSCPATCSDPFSPLNCTLPTQESCICDNGYVLSGGECVSQRNCGCTFEGLYYTEGQSVVLDSDCGRQCTCSNRVMTCHQYQCGPQEVCGINNGVRGCRPTSYATCSVDHLGSCHTFDKVSFSYQGACELTLTRVSGSPTLPYFTVKLQRVPTGSLGFSKILNFEAGGSRISINIGEGRNIQVDGHLVALPYSVNNGQIHIYYGSVNSIILETSFGVTVRSDWSQLIRIKAPNTYNGTLAGLCGNFNENREDEFYSPDGVLLNTAQEFGDSWRNGSLSAFCIDSDVIPQGQNESDFSEYCNIIAQQDGPFAQCHSSLDPQIWLADCRHNLEQTNGAREAMCEALQSYTLLCQQNGISVGEWRNITNCHFTCPAHSHYELCGTSCPPACPSLSFPFPCTQQCQEGCQCDNGLLLSGDQCVPPTGCGCFHEGRYRESGEQFWYGEHCQFYCVCDGTSGNVQCTSSSCQAQEICSVTAGEYGCHSRPSAACSASGDPHYTSFDGHRFDFQGTCYYTLATVCNDTGGLPYFHVIARNEPWNGLPVSITVEVQVNVSGHLVRVSHNMYGTAEIDSQTRNLPAVLDSGHVSVYSSGRSTYITTDFGLRVSYDGSWVAEVTVPGNYSGATCGLCGNFNGDSSDDFRLQSGALTLSASEFGADWKVGNDTACNHGCGDECSSCRDPSRAQSLCAIITDNQGPLSFCHAYVDPQAYFDECVFDLCLSEHRNDVLCRSIETYVSACQSANVRIYPWRENTTCAMTCTDVNSHYELCGSDCGHTCTSSVNDTCSCREGCFCNEGFVRSGGNCVPAEQCGCSYNGFYIQIGEQFWNEGCSQHCECFAPEDLRCISTSCSFTEECVVKNGALGCYSPMSACMVSGDPHYYTFDGAVAHFQGTCSYEISQTCGNAIDGLQFRVVGTNLHRGSTAVSFVSVVDVWLTKEEEQTSVSIGQNRRVKVDGNELEASTYQIGHLAEIYHEHNFVVVNVSNELLVYFDGRFTLSVKLGPRFHGSVCGMCGNNNGDPRDDKTLPNGTLALNDAVFGNSWKSNISSPGCGANVQPGDNDCPFRDEYSELCSIITNSSGPFQHCQFRINPESFFSSCVYDLCAYPQTLGQDLLCSAVEAYDAACTNLGLQIPDWRSDLSCSTEDPCEGLDCNEDEWCGQKDGIYGCFCNENYPRRNPDSYDSTETCESSSGNMSLSRCQLFEAGFSASSIHLNDPNCNGTVHDGRVMFHFDNDNHICGTNLMANGTHFIYENLIQAEVDSPEGAIHRKKRLELVFSCIYQLTQTLSMDTELNPIQSIVHKNLPNGEGLYQVRMIPFEDAGFSHPYSGRAHVEVGQKIYIGVFVQGVDSRQIATVIDSCWATPTNERNYTVRWDLITRKCPNPNDGTVEILKNGISTTGQFSFKMFSFYADESRVFLHCSIHLCLLRNQNCVTRCFPGYHHRSGRSADAHDSASISVGPFIWTAKNRGV